MKAVPPLLISIVLLLAACGQNNPTAAPPAATLTAPGPAPAVQLASEAFEPGVRIPDKYTCKGEDVSPPLQWTLAPTNTQSLALSVIDSDANGFVHWLIYNMPANTTALSEGQPGSPQLTDGSLQGQNSAKKTGYMGPCPPSGTHHYVFTVYALDIKLDLPAEATKDQLFKAMQGHILVQGELTGVYSK